MASRSVGNTSVTYDSLDMTQYLNATSLAGVVAQADTSTFASDGQEQIPTLGDWSVPIGGPWAKALDDVLGAEAVAPPEGSALNTLVVVVGEAGSTVTYTWTTNSFVADYTVDMGSPTSAIMWSGTLKGSGAPVRS